MQCEHGTARAGSAYANRCEKDADKTYLGLGEDNPIDLCQEHYDEYHRGDFLSRRR